MKVFRFLLQFSARFLSPFALIAKAEVERLLSKIEVK